MCVESTPAQLFHTTMLRAQGSSEVRCLIHRPFFARHIYHFLILCTHNSLSACADNAEKFVIRVISFTFENRTAKLFTNASAIDVAGELK